MQAVIFTLLMIAVAVAYFYAWPYPKSHWEFKPAAILIYALGFIGSSMQFLYSLFLPVPTGVFVLCLFIYSTYKKYYRENPAVWAVLLFIILSAFVAAPFRLDWSPLQSRYGLYSITAIILCIVFIMHRVKKSVSHFILAGAICYNLLSGIMFYPEAPIRKLALQKFITDWENGRPVTHNPTVIPEDAEKLLYNAKKSGIWDE